MQKEKSAWRMPFFTIWGGQAFSLLGSQLAQFALVWWLTEETGSATVLALATLVALLPQIFLGPVMGALVDRWNRRVVMIVADACIALVGLVLAYLFWSEALEIWHVYLVMFARALGGAVHWPAMQASTTLLVPKKELSRVGGMNQTLYGLLGITAPPLGALLMEWLPLHGIMLIDVATAALAIGPLFFIHIPQPERAGGSRGVLPLDRCVGWIPVYLGVDWCVGRLFAGYGLELFHQPGDAITANFGATTFPGRCYAVRMVECGLGRRDVNWRSLALSLGWHFKAYYDRFGRDSGVGDRCSGGGIGPVNGIIYRSGWAFLRRGDECAK